MTQKSAAASPASRNQTETGERCTTMLSCWDAWVWRPVEPRHPQSFVSSAKVEGRGIAYPASLPAQLGSLKPNVRRPLGSRGSHPLAAGGIFDAEPWNTTDVPFVVPALRTPRSLCNPRGLVRGHTARCPRLDTYSFRQFPTGQASGGQMGVAPLHSPPGVTPRTPVWSIVRLPLSPY